MFIEGPPLHYMIYDLGKHLNLEDVVKQMNFDGPATEGVGTLSVRPTTIKDKINMAVAEAEQQLAAAKRAQEILTKNPELEELLNIMNNSRVFRY